MNHDEHHQWEENESEELKMAIENIRQQSMPLESLNRTLKAVEEIPLTTAAWKQGFRNMIVFAIPIYLIMGLASVFLTRQFDLPMSFAFGILGFGTMALGFVWMLIYQFIQTSRGVTVLIDCGLVPGRTLFLVQTAIMAIVAIVFFAQGWQLVSVLGGTGFGVFALFWAYLASSRLQFCEEGIRIHHSLAPWNKFKSYSWKDGETPTLFLRSNSRLSMFVQSAFPIPAKLRSEVEQLLIEKLGHPNGSDESESKDYTHES